MTENGDNRQMGIQPLDTVLEKHGLANKDLVSVSTEQLTHKQVQKGRKGRRVTANIQHKILNALNQWQKQQGADEAYRLSDLFNYDG